MLLIRLIKTSLANAGAGGLAKLNQESGELLIALDQLSKPGNIFLRNNIYHVTSPAYYAYLIDEHGEEYQLGQLQNEGRGCFKLNTKLQQYPNRLSEMIISLEGQIQKIELKKLIIFTGRFYLK